MSEHEEAAEAALAYGREKALFEVIDPLTRNGEELAIGQRIKMSRADADILIDRGKIKPAKGRSKPTPPVVDGADAEDAEGNGGAGGK